jgi:hypothetical protein
MSQIEYKTVLLPYKPSVFQNEADEITLLLNKEGGQRWRLSQIVMPSTLWGRANGMVAILERAKV